MVSPVVEKLLPLFETTIRVLGSLVPASAAATTVATAPEVDPVITVPTKADIKPV